MRKLKHGPGDTRFRVIVPFYNASNWLKANVASLKEQTYDNFTVIMVNDCSKDDSVEVALKMIGSDDRFKIIQTEKNGGALASTFLGIKSLNLKSSHEDVIVIVDGDDWLANKNVLYKLNEIYSSDPRILLTYGSYIEYPSGLRGKFSKQVPDNIIKNKLFRESEWMTSHMRTFKYRLWAYTRRKDVLDSNGKIYSMAGDLPVMFPMLEMAGSPKNVKYIHDIMYVYNRTNPLNEDKVNHELQLSIEAEVRAKKKYPSLSAMRKGLGKQHFND